eukprot:3036570-Pyramimonas_sp.AAC.1
MNDPTVGGDTSLLRRPKRSGPSEGRRVGGSAPSGPPRDPLGTPSGTMGGGTSLLRRSLRSVARHNA